MISYRSLADLNRCILENIYRIPRDIGAVVGIPRSGLLAANLVALYLNRPLGSLDAFLEGRILGGGLRLQRYEGNINDVWRKPALVVDDSVLSGETIRAARGKVQQSGVEIQPYFMAIYATKQSAGLVDIYLDICPAPRVFEWNILHHGIIENTCMDIDGVLCRDPTAVENDDGPRYVAFLEKVEPIYIPSRTVRALVTARLEKYRKVTECWLQRHNIRYKELIMLDMPSAKDRRHVGCHAAFKAEMFKRTNAALFIESDVHQAEEIARLSGKEVFCMQTREMIYPNFVSRSTAMLTHKDFWTERLPRAISAKLKGFFCLKTR